MKLRIFQINAFATKVFFGNPAAVCPLPYWLDDDLMQKIAAESHVVTAFFVGSAGRYELRWYTPTKEIQGICGHGTLAAAFVAATELRDSSESIVFRVSEGELRVSRARDDDYVLDLPALTPKPVALDEIMAAAFSDKAEVLLGALDLIAVLPTADEVVAFQPNYDVLLTLPMRAAIVTAPGAGDVDFVSRWFGPKQGTGEDTGFTDQPIALLFPSGRIVSERPRFERNSRLPVGQPSTVNCVMKGYCCTARQ